MIRSVISTRPFPFPSHASQALIPSRSQHRGPGQRMFDDGQVPIAMLTHTISSLTNTEPSPSQSPTHVGGATVGVGVGRFVHSWTPSQATGPGSQTGSSFIWPHSVGQQNGGSVSSQNTVMHVPADSVHPQQHASCALLGGGNNIVPVTTRTSRIQHDCMVDAANCNMHDSACAVLSYVYHNVSATENGDSCRQQLPYYGYGVTEQCS